MKKLSDKAKKLITDFSAATSNLSHNPTQPNYARYCETRDALETFVRNLEAKVAEKNSE
jgi:NAD(P)-dependent dehydrogenase (short-subunit alcohol dehydrogenase family)